MALDIYMYNTWFGDCFRIENGGSNLWIDFGIHSNSTVPGGLTRDDIHNSIAGDILASVNPTLVISHFHEDHVSGLLYMMNHKATSKSKTPIFQKVYIPDIWNVVEAPVIIATLLLEELLKHAKLSGRKGAVTLFELMRFLCVNARNVIPIKRGSSFEGGRYIALWPDPQCVSTYASSYLTSLEIGAIPASLLNLAEMLRSFILERINIEGENVTSENFHSRLNRLETNFLELINNPEIAIILTKLSAIEDDIYLNHLGNNISIVFQNTKFVQGETLLFTGDLENKFLVKIANNYDKKYNMYPSYEFIKIPHHGTKGGKNEHYFDFKPHNPKCFMIPNGFVHGARGNWKICKEYGNDANLKSIKVVCSNSNFCENNCGRRFMTCTCLIRKFVFSNTCVKVP